ncbi:bifunctional 2-polyprenyl-6-hydroxyphenol methylase/3-demethylubiquinol 3-O-methyltransferase UbiG [Prosthecomicrobium hirschii]|uniref:bifunctional 2-polyprenyl-6-hydroxyphenol methylase/3-demethylubiquinol 3-O-methyltransferase UbiG n=1 Tax=Prosthecodimorpha hirschii TaxID=665126 RepID=UPI00221FEB38|nr:bifunctional 2-polyprenyl-6-hydroxyphenol methylase/3-demethylubiquinol 3-O-methyltransferase UbiG [Prosthecomicrobium hirschii]MCW1841978.1 bifunctional 2-polyprenyl-6-hydroxyphenol methylase/3-demethylubiquinol 3-O-methyltransferase UbiG [Prosthecomicrobium hirschii]
MSAAPASTVDDAEIRRFSAMAAEWWNPAGKFRPLHKFNPVRLGYIKQEVSARFGRDAQAPDAFAGLSLLDIGCGGGLLSEPMARLGATVVGADASETNIEVARLHAAEAGLAIDYRATTAEDLAASGATFDVVLAMEIVEHVADVGLFVSTVAGMVRPGGLLIMATLNRTLKSYALAIVGAEYVLRWLPRGTHDWRKFLTPAELSRHIEASGLTVIDRVGVVYDPLRDRWSRNARDLDVNYMLLAGRD